MRTILVTSISALGEILSIVADENSEQLSGFDTKLIKGMYNWQSDTSDNMPALHLNNL